MEVSARAAHPPPRAAHQVGRQPRAFRVAALHRGLVGVGCLSGHLPPAGGGVEASSMNINERGHLTMDGMPVTRPEEQAHYVGTRERFIAFAYCVLGDGRVVVHSTLIDVFDDTVEDFLYEVAERREAYETAS